MCRKFPSATTSTPTTKIVKQPAHRDDFAERVSFRDQLGGDVAHGVGRHASDLRENAAPVGSDGGQGIARLEWLVGITLARESAAGHAHMAGERRALVAAVDDEIVALGLARDRFVDRGVQQIVASEARSGARRSAASSWPRHI